MKMQLRRFWVFLVLLAGIEIPFPQRDLHLRSSIACHDMTPPAPQPAGA